MPYYVTGRRFRRRGLGLPPLNPDGSGFPPMRATPIVAMAPGACPGTPGCPGYVPPIQNLQNLLSAPDTGLSPATAALLAAAASAQNPNLPTGSSFTDWLNAHATAAVVIGGIAAGILLLSRL